MHSHLFELLENVGWISGNTVTDRLDRASVDDILQVVKDSAQVTAASDLVPVDSVFEHSATLSLSGGRHPCASIECRRSRIDELARFAAFYSDRVYIRNILSDHSVHPDKHIPVEELRDDIRDDLTLLIELRPLVEAGRIVPLTPPGNRCPRCLWERDAHSEERLKLAPVRQSLSLEFLARMKVSLRKVGHGYQVIVQAPDDLLEHAVYLRQEKIPSSVRAMPAIRSALAQGRTVLMTGELKSLLKLHERFAGQVFTDIIFEMVVAQALHTSFLTERPVHLRVLANVTHTAEIDRRNLIAEKYLTTLVPFAGDVPTSDLLKLRTREEEAFIMFRSRLNTAIDELRRLNADVTESHARQLYSDVLLPALASIDKRVSAAKRDLVQGALKRSAAWIGAISFGMYSGLVPTDLSALAGSLGLLKVLQESGEMLLSTATAESTVRTDPMFFLWKVRQKSKSKSTAA